MEVRLDSEEAAMARRDRKGKRRRPQGRTVRRSDDTDASSEAASGRRVGSDAAAPFRR
jgi:hypothetical protein